MLKSRIQLYFKEKVLSYKLQDKKADREFIDAKWITEQLENNKCCRFCKCYYEIFFNEDSFIVSNLTVDRINNNLPHIKSNSQLCCHHCNITKGNRY
jgi:hypothetical protein